MISVEYNKFVIYIVREMVYILSILFIMASNRTANNKTEKGDRKKRRKKAAEVAFLCKCKSK